MERSFSFSDTESTSEVRRLRGPWGSASETDLMRKALVDELHQRFSSAESLNRGGTAGRYRHHQRAASISGLSRGDQDWKSTSIEEMRARKSSKSIEVRKFLEGVTCFQIPSFVFVLFYFFGGEGGGVYFFCRFSVSLGISQAILRNNQDSRLCGCLLTNFHSLGEAQKTVSQLYFAQIVEIPVGGSFVRSFVFAVS